MDNKIIEIKQNKNNKRKTFRQTNVQSMGRMPNPYMLYSQT